MNFIETNIKGAYLIKLTPSTDHRGFFSRTFCAKEFRKNGLKFNMVQSNLSVTLKRNTIRGMHFQTGSAKEAKLIRCIKGAICDVIIDLRKDSASYGQFYKVELSEKNLTMLYVPENFAHGFLTITNQTEVFYQVSNYYNPSKERGIRWNDPFFEIDWSIKTPIVSIKDANYPDFKGKGR